MTATLRKAGFRFDKELNSDLNFYIAGGGATRRLEHTLDLSNRLLYDLGSLPAVSQLQLKSLLGFDQSASLIPIPLSLVQGLRTAGIPSLATPAQVQALLPEPSLLSYNPLTWADIASGVVPFQDFSISRFEQYGELTNDSGHVVCKT
jgi:hypothetical protein